jgi:hypothetical protein
LGCGTIASPVSVETRVIVRSAAAGLALVTVTRQAFAPADSLKLSGTADRESELVKAVARMEILSMAAPELLPLSLPRQVAQRICTLG